MYRTVRQRNLCFVIRSGDIIHFGCGAVFAMINVSVMFSKRFDECNVFLKRKAVFLYNFGMRITDIPEMSRLMGYSRDFLLALCISLDEPIKGSSFPKFTANTPTGKIWVNKINVRLIQP